MAFRLNKQRFRQEAFDEVFRNGGAIQAEAYASGQLQETMVSPSARARKVLSCVHHMIDTDDGFLPLHAAPRLHPAGLFARYEGAPVTFGERRHTHFCGLDAQHRACARRSTIRNCPGRARTVVRDREGARAGLGADQRAEPRREISFGYIFNHVRFYDRRSRAAGNDRGERLVGL